jgi:Uma2 family endonuclease
MNMHAAQLDQMPATPDDFLRWNEGHEGKREFVDGKVVEMMINVRFAHFRLAARLQNQLAAALADTTLVVGGSDFAVRAGASVRYPDVLIITGDHEASALSTTEPLLVAEVLPPATMAADFGPKRFEYLALPTLRHYLILAQDARRLWLWSRDAEGRFGEPELHDIGTVDLAGFGITLDLPTLYAGIA